jgi:hypothetical protein
MKIAKRKVARVTWIDSFRTYGWCPEGEVKDGEEDLIESIGIVVNDYKKSIVLSTSISRHTNFIDMITIPKIAVRKIRYI